ncbi:MAG: spermidine synthase, partial [Candidatus Acidiferrales bacterium]
SLPFCFALAQRIPFDPFLLLWDWRQWFSLAAYYLVFFLPFFLGATAVALLLTEQAQRAPRVYFCNLLGSGLGSLLLVLFLYLGPPERAVLLTYLLALTAAVLVIRVFPAGPRVALLAILVLTFFAFESDDALKIRLSQYKGLSLALNLPDAKIEQQRNSPLGRVDVLRSPAFRHAPGLSLVSPSTPPQQLGLFVDGEAAGALTAFDGRREPLEFLDWTTTAAPYHMLARPTEARVLILGAGGGSDVLLALYHGSGRIDAVELNPQIIELTQKDYGQLTGGLYDLPQVHTHVREARGFLEALPPGETFDLIQISLLDSLAASAAGVHALNESYLYTVEAFDAYLDHLRPGSVLAVTRWLKMPPRDNLKIFATAVEALEAGGVQRPGDHLVLVRSWATATLLLKRSPFTPEEIAALKAFAELRLFDLDHYPGIQPADANRFNRLDRSYYHDGAQEILAGGARREAFFRNYPFNIHPARDDRPYFNHFFKWEALPLLLKTYGGQWLPFLEWGYLLLVATMVQAVVFSVALILLPLFFRRGQTATSAAGPSRARVFLYFLAIGLGFLFIEIVLIQKLTLFLANPIYAIAVVLAGVLVYSGIGSLLSAYVRHLRVVCALIAFFAVAAALILPWYLPKLIGLPTPWRVFVALVLMLPLGLVLGMPFPVAWKRLGAQRPDWLPWAWGVNGCASVLAAVLATLLAMSFGFRLVLFTAAALYLLAGVTAPEPSEDTSE